MVDSLIMNTQMKQVRRNVQAYLAAINARATARSNARTTPYKFVNGKWV